MQKAKRDQIVGHNIGPCKVICVLVESYTKNRNKIFRQRGIVLRKVEKPEFGRPFKSLLV